MSEYFQYYWAILGVNPVSNQPTEERKARFDSVVGVYLMSHRGRPTS